MCRLPRRAQKGNREGRRFRRADLKYYVTKLGPADFTMIPGLFERNNYGFAFSKAACCAKKIIRYCST